VTLPDGQQLQVEDLPELAVRDILVGGAPNIDIARYVAQADPAIRAAHPSYRFREGTL
jgi:hypothetical protein